MSDVISGEFNHVVKALWTRIEKKHIAKKNTNTHTKKLSNQSLFHEQGSKRSEQFEPTSEWTSKWPSSSVCILGCSGPQWKDRINQ